jgi:hypothetical protein
MYLLPLLLLLLVPLLSDSVTSAATSTNCDTIRRMIVCYLTIAAGCVVQARIIVNEEGTEAAAATAVLFEEDSFIDHDTPIPFTVNRPFILVLRDRRANVALFVGQIVQL